MLHYRRDLRPTSPLPALPAVSGLSVVGLGAAVNPSRYSALHLLVHFGFLSIAERPKPAKAHRESTNAAS